MDKVSLTRLDLKKQRERMARFERFLPALQLRQRQLQRALETARSELAVARTELAAAEARFDAYRSVLGDLAGLDLHALAEPEDVRVGSRNVAGVQVPVLEKVSFRPATYSLFATPAWTDRALADMRVVSVGRAEVEVLERVEDLVARELTRVVQRVNLFEKVKIPEARDAIHRIRVHLGDEMAASVGRAKIAKSRQEAVGRVAGGPERPR